MSLISVAAVQMACSEDLAANLDKIENLIRQAAARGAQIILLQELFATPYFCKRQDSKYFNWAYPLKQHPFLPRFAALARDLGVVLPISLFERANNAFFNTVVMIDADGKQLGFYRKTHIPDGPGYQEKFYFCPGDTGFKIWETAYAKLGLGICWDQWFPEAARCMAVAGAELLLYPTAIGSEPHRNDVDSKEHWQRVMQGHAAANLMPLVCANRIGTEVDADCSLTFYGSSFITDETGAIIAQADRQTEAILTAGFDLTAIAQARYEWSVFRDRRPDLYTQLLELY